MRLINEQANLFNQIFFEQMEIGMAGLGNLMNLGSLGRPRSDTKNLFSELSKLPNSQPVAQFNTAPSRWGNRGS